LTDLNAQLAIPIVAGQARLNGCRRPIISALLTIPEITLLTAGGGLGYTGVYLSVPNISGNAGRSSRGIDNSSAGRTIPEEASGASNNTSASESTGVESGIPCVSLRASRGNAGNHASQTNQNISGWTGVACAR
jgi:hypothetical protein